MGVKREYQYTIEAGTEYEVVAPSATDQVLGGTGSLGDVLGKLVVNVTTSATGTVSIKDGAGSAITLVPANTPIGTYTVWLGIRSTSGAWSVTTGAGASVLAIGQFST